MGEADGSPVMGSVRYQKDGQQKHWTDKWHKFIVNRASRLRQKKSLPGQKFLFDNESADDPEATQKK